MDDLREYTEKVLARKSRNIEPLPEIKLIPTHTYSFSKDSKDPFEPLFQEDESPLTAQEEGSGIKPPDRNRHKEELEAFPLDSLRMVGTVEKQDQIWGVVVDREGTIYRVQVNNYMGRNYGKITSILEDKIELIEIIPDGQGGWQERDAALALSE